MKQTGKFLAGLLLISLLAACSRQTDTIIVVSRELGSGTRAAFVELTGIMQKTPDGETLDLITDIAEITNSTAVMMQSIADSVSAIGYISLGSLNDTVKALTVDGVSPTTENIKNGTYAISRAFQIVTKGEQSKLAQDFIRFILSAEGQAVVESAGYVSAGNQGAYEGSSAEGKLVISGSSSVSPVMEKLKEAYVALHPAVTIEIHTSDSTTGINTVIAGACHIGMTSRTVTATETAKGVAPLTIAMDGIVVIVSKENPISSLTKDQIRAIFKGEITSWNALSE
jgi:phosphate transport system substrate-binding protein